MHMRIWYIAALAALIAMSYVPTARAASAEGAGIRLCSDVMQDYKKAPHAGEDFYFSWAEGFMSRLNIARLNDASGGFEAMPLEQQKAHLRDFCPANPTKKYFEAVIDLYTRIYPRQAMR